MSSTGLVNCDSCHKISIAWFEPNRYLCKNRSEKTISENHANGELNWARTSDLYNVNVAL